MIHEPRYTVTHVADHTYAVHYPPRTGEQGREGTMLDMFGDAPELVQNVSVIENYPDGPWYPYLDADECCVSAPTLLAGGVLNEHGRIYAGYAINEEYPV